MTVKQHNTSTFLCIVNELRAQVLSSGTGQKQQETTHETEMFASCPQVAPSLWLCKTICMVKSLLRSNFCDDLIYLF